MTRTTIEVVEVVFELQGGMPSTSGRHVWREHDSDVVEVVFALHDAFDEWGRTNRANMTRTTHEVVELVFELQGGMRSTSGRHA